MTTLADLQSALDYHKEKMTDQVYLDLSNRIMKMTQQSHYYQVSYVYPQFMPCNDGMNRLSHSIKRVVAKLPCERVVVYRQMIQTEGYADVPVKYFEHLDITFFVFDTDRNDPEEDQEEVGGILPYVEVNMETLCVTSILDLNDN
jgi:hypothetical protein